MTNEEGQEYYNETMPLSKGAAPISDERLAEIEAATQPKASMVTLEPQEVRAVIARIRIAEAANRGLYGANVSQRNQYESERDALRATAFQAQEMAKEQMAQVDALRAQVETLREALVFNLASSFRKSSPKSSTARIWALHVDPSANGLTASRLTPPSRQPSRRMG